MVRALRKARPDIRVRQVDHARAPAAVRERVQYVPAFVLGTRRPHDAVHACATTGRTFVTSAALARWYDRWNR